MTPFLYKELLNRQADSIHCSCLLKTNERLRSKIYGWLRVIESMQFLKISLDAIVRSVRREEKSLQEKFILIKKLLGEK